MRPPDIVLVTLDTTRADHLGPYGYFRDTTPFLTRFAQQAVVFEDAVVPMATTLPTHTSILTGTYPLEHGVLANLAHTGHYFQPSAGLRSFAEFCRDAGYRTAAFVSAVPLKRASGIEAGFDHFVEPPADVRERSAAATTDLVLDWLDDIAEDERPLLLWVHYFDPHWPYEAPAEFELFKTDEALEAWLAERSIPESVYRRKAGEDELAAASHNLYDAELRYLDHQLERLFARLDQRPRASETATVIVGDHGEALCQHDRTGHGSVWHEQLHAPLLMRVPGVLPRRVNTTVSVVDALPTLLGQLDAPALAPFLDQARGRDVLASDFVATPVLSQDTGVRIEDPGAKVYRHSLTEGRWKLVRIDVKKPRPGDSLPAVTYQLYDRQSDPHELNDLAASEPDRVRELDRLLVEMIEDQRRAGTRLGSGERATERADDELIQDLRGLGYVIGEEDEAESEATAPVETTPDTEPNDS